MPRATQKKRPGVEAGINLIALNNVGDWEKVESHSREVIDSIPHLAEREEAMLQLAPKTPTASSSGTASSAATARKKTFFTKSDLDAIVLWKHTVGKNRIYNVKYLNANSEESIQQHSRRALEMAYAIQLHPDGDIDQDAHGRAAIQEALSELGKLKGVGPATASAILTLVRPDVFCYLYDEVIDCFEPQRDYKLSNYLRVNAKCLQLAHALHHPEWTTSRVAKTIWIAARFLALHGQDLTTQLNNNTNANAKVEGHDSDSGDQEDNEDEDGEEGGGGGDEASSDDGNQKPKKRSRTR